MMPPAGPHDTEDRLRPSQALGTSAFPQYFRETGPATFDIVVYELSLRPTIPLMDLLYFEFLRSCLESEKVKKVVVFPWNGWHFEDDESTEESQLAVNLPRVFGAYWPSVEIVSGAQLIRFSDLILTREFFNSLERFGESVFLREASKLMGSTFRTTSDINRGHPSKLKVRATVEHSIRGWLISNYLQAEHLETHEAERSLRVASLLWEQELLKTLLLNHLQEHSEVEWGLLVGKTITYRQRGRHPLPNFDNSRIDIFGY
jgi:hypothetical protein